MSFDQEKNCFNFVCTSQIYSLHVSWLDKVYLYCPLSVCILLVPANPIIHCQRVTTHFFSLRGNNFDIFFLLNLITNCYYIQNPQKSLRKEGHLLQIVIRYQWNEVQVLSKRNPRIYKCLKSISQLPSQKSLAV